MIDYNSEDIQVYCKRHTNPNNTLLSKLEKYTWENEDIPQMISGQMVGKFLQSAIQMIDAKKIVEVGTFTGYSALQMAEVLPEDGEIHTCELMEKHAKTAQSFFNKSEHGKKITIHQGPGISSLENLKIGSFDMAFIDADKSNYMEYYKRCLALIRNGGIVILDNMLWGGSVINPNDDDSKSLRKTAEYIQKDVRVFNILVPIRDGLMLCIKNEK